MFRGLDLTEEQKAKVKELQAASRTALQPNMEALKANREKMQGLTATGAFDEVQVTALANEQAALSAKLIVERERVKSQVFALLTDAQKTKLAEMKAKRDERRKARMAEKTERLANNKFANGQGGQNSPMPRWYRAVFLKTINYQLTTIN